MLYDRCYISPRVLFKSVNNETPHGVDKNKKKLISNQYGNLLFAYKPNKKDRIPKEKKNRQKIKIMKNENENYESQF